MYCIALMCCMCVFMYCLLFVCFNVHSHYGAVLQKLFTQVERETSLRCIDNIVAAVCRMIMAKPDCVPLDQVRQPF